MSNYKETTTQLSLMTWFAAKLAQCFNDFNGIPVIKFHEVERKAIGEELISESYTNRKLEAPANDPRFQQIPYIDIGTFEQLPLEAGYFTPDQIYYALACLYIATAKEADKEAAAIQGTFPVEDESNYL